MYNNNENTYNLNDEILNGLIDMHSFIREILDEDNIIDDNIDIHRPPLYSFMNNIDRVTLNNILLVFSTMSDDLDNTTHEEKNTLSLEEFYNNSNKIKCKSTHECTICLDNIRAGDECIQIKCGHTFHEICIQRWLMTKNSTCPICRSTTNIEDDSVENTKQ